MLFLLLNCVSVNVIAINDGVYVGNMKNIVLWPITNAYENIRLSVRALLLYKMVHIEHINLAYSLKNIPIPTRSEYKLLLTDKIENLIKRMRWKAHSFLKGKNSNNDAIDNFNLI